MPPRIAALACCLWLTQLACAPTEREARRGRGASPQAFQLLRQVEEQPTASFTQLRKDLDVDTRDFEHVPHVVATGETPVLRLDGARAKLYGDAAATQGWSVDNFLLLEAFSEKGQVISRAVVGFNDGVTLGADQIDSIGRMTFRFDPGEVDLSAMLPEHDRFRLRASALDVGGVGRVSDLFLVLHPREGGRDDRWNE